MGQSSIRTWCEAQVECCCLCSSRGARIDDNELATIETLCLEVLHHRWHRLRQIASYQQDDLGLRNIFQWERQPPIDAEGFESCCRCRRHTETTIIVDARGTQSHASELAQQVCLLVRERTTAKDANGVPAIARLSISKGLHHAQECLVPRDRHECARGVTCQRGKKALRMGECSGSGPTLDAEPTLVHWERRFPDDGRLFTWTQQAHPTLERTIRAVCHSAHGLQAMSRFQRSSFLHTCPPVCSVVW